MIDWPRVNELREEVGTDDFDEVVELFLEEVEDVIDRLRDNPDRTRLDEDLHFLKGSALSLGFNGFSDLCQTGERQFGEGQADAIDVAGIVSAFDQSKAVFLSQMKDNLAA